MPIDDFSKYYMENVDAFLYEENKQRKIEKIKSNIKRVRTLYSKDIFEDFNDLTDEQNRKIELLNFRRLFFDFILDINNADDEELFSDEMTLMIHNMISRYEHLLHLIKVANRAVAKQNRAKQNRTDPNKQKAIDEAIILWKRTPRLSLDDVAGLIKDAEISDKSHSIIKQWIAPFNPKRRK